MRRAALVLLLIAAAGAARAAPVSGRVATPTGVVPALTVHAWSLTGAKLYSVTTDAGQASYTIDLPRGRYWLFAMPAEPGAPAIYGAHTEFVACLRAAERARDGACRAHALRPVAVGAERVDGVDVSDWRLDDAVTHELDRLLGRPEEDEAADEAQLAAPRFSEYPAAGLAGPRATALAAGGAPQVARDRDMLVAALGSAPNFAGRIVLVRIGCGSECESAALVDLASGRVDYPPALATLPALPALPAAAACSARGALQFRRDSRLLMVTARTRTELVTRYFVYEPEHATLRLVASLTSTLDERCAPRR